MPRRKKTKTDAWMPLYIGDYLGDTSSLNTAQHGAYLLLLMEYWRKGPLPDDDDKLATIAKLTRKEWDKGFRGTIRAFFEPTNGKLHQKRADEEMQHAREVSDKRREAAEARHGSGGKGGGPGSGSGCNSNANASGLHGTGPEHAHTYASPNGSFCDANAPQMDMQNGVHSHSQSQSTYSQKEEEEKRGGRGLERRCSLRAIRSGQERTLRLFDGVRLGDSDDPNRPRQFCAGIKYQNSVFLEPSIAAICELIGRGEDWPGDWQWLINWLNAGSPKEVILDAIRAQMEARMRSPSKQMEPVWSLRLFDKAVQERTKFAKRVAA